MRRFFASTSTHTQTQRFSETANLSESRGEISNKARINAALPITVQDKPPMNFGDEHSTHCLRYGQAPRGRRSAYRLEDTTMAPPRRPEIVIGIGAWKSSHWACLATRDGEVLASKPVANRENALDSL